MQVEKPTPNAEFDEDKMSDDTNEQRKKRYDPDDYGETWWANSLDEEEERSASSHEERKKQYKTEEFGRIS